MNQIEDGTGTGPAAQGRPGRRRPSRKKGKQPAPASVKRTVKVARLLSPPPDRPAALPGREADTRPRPPDEQPARTDRSGPPDQQTPLHRRGQPIIGALHRLRAAVADYIRPAPPDQADRQTAQPTTAPTRQAETPPQLPRPKKGPTRSPQPLPHANDAPDAIPPALRIRYLVVDDKFYFRDREQALAFEDQGKRIATVHDDAEVAHSMVTLAQAKGWTSLKLRGSDEFKREAWLAAALMEMDVSGYRPSDIDKARLAERQSERAQDKPNTIQRELPPARPQPAPVDMPVARNAAPPPIEDRADGLGKRQQRAIDALASYLRKRGDSEQTIAMTVALASEQMLQRRAHFGQLIEHGEAPYKNDPDQESSYFVTLQTDRGRQTIWGVNLARAIGDSGVAIGDDILLSRRSARNVTVPVYERDPSGRPLGDKTYLDTHRNDWEVSSLDGARDFPTPGGKGGQAGSAPVVAQPPTQDRPRRAASPPPAREPEPFRTR